MQNMGKGLQKLFKAVVNELLEALPILGESGSAVSYLIPWPKNFLELTILSEDTSKPWLEENLKDIQNLINNQKFLVNETENGEVLTPCMNFYKAKIQSDESLQKIKMGNVY